jgi:hypothetical protein
MKRQIFTLACLLILSCLIAIPVCAQNPQGAGTEAKSKRVHVQHFHWWHHEKHSKVKTAPLYSVPKSGGWWHRHQPGPAGAGAK